MPLTVTTPATDRNLLTLPELRAAIGLAETDTSKDATLTVLGARISDTLARTCLIATGGVTPPTFRLETLTETFRQRRRVIELVLSRRPIASVTSVHEDGIEVEAADFEIDAASGLLRRLSSDEECYWPCGKIVVVYRAGWATVPEDLKLAASKMANQIYRESARDPNLKRVVTEGVGEREYWVAPTSDPLVPAEVMELLGDYINHGVG